MPVTFETLDDGIARLCVDRPAVRNALDWAAMDAFADAVEKAHSQVGLRALILTGTGKAFIAGGDLRALHGGSTEADGWKLSRMMTASLHRLEALPCPVIAAINGPARGGGAEIALACDLRVVAEDASLGFAQITLGLIPGWGGGQRLLRLVRYSRAFDLLTTGRVLSAQEMLEDGLADRVSPVGGAFAEALALAHGIRQHTGEAVRAIKRSLQAGLWLPPAAAEAYEQGEFPALWASDFHQQAVENWLQRRERKDD